MMTATRHTYKSTMIRAADLVVGDVVDVVSHDRRHHWRPIYEIKDVARPTPARYVTFVDWNTGARYAPTDLVAIQVVAGTISTAPGGAFPQAPEFKHVGTGPR